MAKLKNNDPVFQKYIKRLTDFDYTIGEETITQENKAEAFKFYKETLELLSMSKNMSEMALLLDSVITRYNMSNIKEMVDLSKLKIKEAAENGHEVLKAEDIGPEVIEDYFRFLYLLNLIEDIEDE